MAKSPKTKTRAANLNVPQSAEEAAKFIAAIGLRAREVARVEHAMNDAIAAIKERAENDARGHGEEIKSLTEGLRIFCEANRQKLTDDGKVKFHEFGTGKVEWRTLPPKVTIAKGVKAEDIIAWCKNQIPALQVEKFVRVKEELNKDAMLEDRERASIIPGVTIGSAGEQFAVTPFEAQIEGGK